MATVVTGTSAKSERARKAIAQPAASASRFPSVKMYSVPTETPAPAISLIIAATP